MGIDVGTESVHDIDCVVRFEFPRPRLEGVGSIVESTDWAEINNVAGEFIVYHSFDVGADFIFVATSDLTESKLPSNLFGKADTSSAVDAPSHRCLNKWA